MAVAHRMLIIAWHIIHDGAVYRELGGNHQDRLNPDRSARRLIRRLEQIGLEVNVKAKVAEAAPVPESVTPAAGAGARIIRRARPTTSKPPSPDKNAEFIA